MCFAAAPALLMGVSTAASLVGTGVSAYGAYQSSQSQAQALDYRANQDEILARDARLRGAVDEQKTRRTTSSLEGRQRAVMSAGNVDLGSGSALDVLGDTAQYGELDAQTVRNNARREEAQYREDATMSRMGSSDTRTAGALNAFATVTSGVGNLADKWYKPVYSAPGAKAWGNW